MINFKGLIQLIVLIFVLPFHLLISELIMDRINQNIRGVNTKTLDILNLVLIANYDVICLCETWLSDAVLFCKLFDNRYTVYRGDCSYEFKNKYNKSHGGGVIKAVKNTFFEL